MARPGPKPKPNYLRIVKAAKPGRLNRREPRPPTGLPSPPGHLGPDALEEWHRCAADLHKAGLLASVDRAILALYAQSWGRLLAAERIIAADAARDPDGAGLLARTANGTVVQAVAVGLARRAAHDVARFAAELGMTPSARSRVTATPPPDDDDPAAIYFR